MVNGLTGEGAIVPPDVEVGGPVEEGGRIHRPSNSAEECRLFVLSGFRPRADMAPRDQQRMSSGSRETRPGFPAQVPPPGRGGASMDCRRDSVFPIGPRMVP